MKNLTDVIKEISAARRTTQSCIKLQKHFYDEIEYDPVIGESLLIGVVCLYYVLIGLLIYLIKHMTDLNVNRVYGSQDIKLIN